MDSERTRITRAAGGVVALAMALTLVAALPAFARTDISSGGTGPCALTKGTSETVQGFSKRLIRCAAGRWAVPGGSAKAICIAARESGLVPTATSPGGDYLGLYQHSATYWPSRYRAWTLDTWHLKTTALSGRTNAVVTIRMVHARGGWAAAGWPVRGC